MSEFTHRQKPADAEEGDLDAQAAEWLIARQGEGWTAQRARALTDWLQASPAHRAAFDHAEQTWAALGLLREEPALVAALAGPSSVASATMVAVEGPARARRSWRGARWAGATFTVMLAMITVNWAQDDVRIALAADYRTGSGELKDIDLADGSRVRLGARSAIAVRFDSGERRLELLRGEALFEAAPVSEGGEPRPFVVSAALGRTRALGTRFVVEQLGHETRVTGVEHQIAVSLQGAGAASGESVPTVLSPGQTVRYGEKGIGPVQVLSTERATAWLQRVLVFDRMTLSDVVDRLNRYHGTHIMVRGEALAQRQVSGVFPPGDPGDALRAIADEIGARSLHLPGLTVLY